MEGEGESREGRSEVKGREGTGQGEDEELRGNS